MKKIFLLLFISSLFLISCGDDDNKFGFQVLEVKSIDFEDIDEELYIGDLHKLTLIVDANGDMTPEMFNWSSSDKDIISVSGSGEITVEGEGEATITASWHQKSGSITIKGYRTLVQKRFDMSMEQVNPDIIISDDFAYDLRLSRFLTLNAYKFENDKLSSVWYCCESTGAAPSELRKAFEHNINIYNPPQALTFAPESNSLSEDSDSLTWIDRNYKLLIRNGEILYKTDDADVGEMRPFLIVEFSQTPQ